jgi:NADPH-dependent 2,4-dienoyl-CoA reductase/sulfur reductase-like enzyme
MRRTKYLIVGGGIASARAVEAIRNRDRWGRIVLVTDEPYFPYDRPPLSKGLVRGDIEPHQISSYPRLFYLKRRVRVLRSVRVSGLSLSDSKRSASFDFIRRKGEGQGLNRRVGTILFQYCLLATGGRPAPLPVPGAELEGVHTLRTISDSLALRRSASDALGGNRRAVVIGAGFIGIEIAASLRQLGVEVTVIERERQVWPGFADEAVAAFVQSQEAKAGVEFLLGEQVVRIHAGKNNTHVAAVETSTGKRIDCSLVCVATGIRPNVELAAAAGLTVSAEAPGGVVVNERMETSFASDASMDSGAKTGVYAAGDIVNYSDPIFDVRRRVEHFGQAEYTGLLAGTIMAGGTGAYDLLTYVWSDFLDIHVEFSGFAAIRERTILRGTPDQGNFIALYVAGDRLVGFLGVNAREAEFGPLRMMIQRRIPISGFETLLEDSGSDLMSFVTQYLSDPT